MTARSIFITLIVSVLMLTTNNAFALKKCMINGKPTYKDGICTEGTEKPIINGQISDVSSEGLRSDMIAREQRINRELAIEAERIKAKEATRNYYGGSSSAHFDNSGHLQGQINRLENQIENQRIQNNLQQLMR